MTSWHRVDLATVMVCLLLLVIIMLALFGSWRLN